jgi:hypothetical protein
MFGWFKKKDARPAVKTLEWIEYNGFRIAATPIPENGQYRLAGEIQKGEADNLRKHQFVRADMLPTVDEANDFSIAKAKMMIDQLGDKVFD